MDWCLFKEGLKTENRYFNRDAEAFLTSVFQGIEGHNTIAGGPIVVEAGPGTNIRNLYRARVFQTEGSLREAMKRPDKHVGPPPDPKATAGRMNAGGISVFYGATDPNVALAEVRPPVGSKVLIGKFEVIETLRLLDLEALERIDCEEGSMLDLAHLYRMQRAEFLRGLAALISRPVMPDDQPSEYLPTQAIADFLATVDPPLHGMIYPSTQIGHMPAGRQSSGLRSAKDRRNVVLFRKVARVQPLNIPESSTIYVSDDNWLFSLFPDDRAAPCEYPELKYTVGEEVPSTAASSGLDNAPLKFTSLDVHFVYGVRIDTISSPVNRHRVRKSEAQEKT